MSFVQTFVDAFKKAAGKSLDKANVDTKELTRSSGGLGSTNSGESFTPLRPAPQPGQQPGLDADYKVAGIADGESAGPQGGGEGGASLDLGRLASSNLRMAETEALPATGDSSDPEEGGEVTLTGAGAGFTPIRGLTGDYKVAGVSAMGDSSDPEEGGEVARGIEGEAKDDIHKVSMEQFGTRDDGELSPGLKVEDAGNIGGGTIFKEELLDGGLKLDHKVGDLKVGDVKYDDDMKYKEFLDWKSKDGLKMSGEPDGGQPETPLGEVRLSGEGFKVEGDDALLRNSPFTPGAPSPIPTPYPAAPEDDADGLEEIARKAGGSQQEYLVVKMQDAQVTSYAQSAPGETVDDSGLEGLKVSGDLAESVAARGKAATSDIVFTKYVDKSSPQLMNREEPQSSTLADLDGEVGAGRVDVEAASAADLPDLDLDADVDGLEG